MEYGNKIMDVVTKVLRVPDRAGNLAKIEHAVALYIGYVCIKKTIELGPKGLVNAAAGSVMRFAKKLPGVSGAVAKEQEAILDKIKEAVLGDQKDATPHRSLPAVGTSVDSIIEEIRSRRSNETRFAEHKGHGGIYHLEGGELARLQNAAFRLYNASNALYPGLFPAVRKFEAEIVRMVVTMLNGDAEACGALASGGTESVLLAVLAYREWGRKKGIHYPEIVGCVSAHAALHKACHYFGVKLVTVPQDSNFQMDVAATKKAITRNTVAIYSSAPTFPHGAVDDIETLGALAKSKNIGLHVDNCLGGFLLSYMKKEGMFDRNFDFSVEGVTSISVDVHKYGMAAKGASCILYKTTALRRCQYTSVADWTGGLYCSPTMQGSRSGAVMAAAWATLIYFGDAGYRELARKLGGLHKKLKETIPTIPGLKVLGTPNACVVPFTSDDFSIYVLADEMSKRGWEVPRLQNPAACHICVAEQVIEVADKYLADLRECAQICMDTRGQGKEKEGMAGIYGMAGSLPDRTVVTDLLDSYIDVLYTVEEETN